MAIAGYGEMARILGYNDVANKFSNAARKMGIEWEKWQMTVTIIN